MTEYESTLAVAIKTISELIEDNRKLRATIENRQEAEGLRKANQRYKIDVDVLTGLLEMCNGFSASYTAKLISNCPDKFIISDGGDL